MQNPKFCAHVERSSFGLFNCMVVFVCMYLYEGERETSCTKWSYYAVSRSYVFSAHACPACSIASVVHMM